MFSKKSIAAACGVAMATGVALAPNAMAYNPKPPNAIITGIPDTVHPGSSFTVHITDKVTHQAVVGAPVSFKIDDGKGYGASLEHGRGVVAKGTTDADGSVNITIDCKVNLTDPIVENGQHWLRGLAKKADGTKLSAKGGSFTFDSSPVGDCGNPGGLG